MGLNGAYILLLELDEELEVQVGSLGILRFSPGIYAYTGSAKRGLKARIKRHLGQEKSTHWHIDYLTPHAARIHAVIVPAQDPPECFIGRHLGRMAKIVVKGFGAGDCSCPSHLAYLGESRQASTPEFGGSICGISRTKTAP